MSRNTILVSYRFRSVAFPSLRTLTGALDGRWYRTRFLPILGKEAIRGKMPHEICVDGVIGVIMDVTELKDRETELVEEGREKRQAMANEAAAKEANRLKGQFLANVRMCCR